MGYGIRGWENGVGKQSLINDKYNIMDLNLLLVYNFGV